MGFSDATSLAIESWTLYAIAILTVSARLASRTILLGSVKKWEVDDYLMIFIVLLYTVVIVGVNQTSVNLNNYLPDSFFATITPAETASAIYGSKWAFATEISKVSMVWLCKACMLILYNHMTNGLPKYHRAVKFVAAYTLLGYLVVMICYLAAWCHPITAYWKVPVSASQSQCASYYDHLINDAVWNISSDLLVLCLPLPLLVKAQLPMRRKIILVGIFSLGVLVILCAILNRYYNFTGGFGDLSYLNWYAGETSTAVIVVNVPHLWPLISRLLGLGSFKSSSAGLGHGHGSSSNNHRFTNGTLVNSSLHHGGGIMGSKSKDFDHAGYMRSESEERIASKGAWVGKGSDIEMGHVVEGDDDNKNHHHHHHHHHHNMNMSNGNVYAATVEAGGRRRGAAGGGGVDDEEEDGGGVWGLHTSSHPVGSVGEGIVKTVHLNQYAE